MHTKGFLLLSAGNINRARGDATFQELILKNITQFLTGRSSRSHSLSYFSSRVIGMEEERLERLSLTNKSNVVSDPINQWTASKPKRTRCGKAVTEALPYVLYSNLKCSEGFLNSWMHMGKVDFIFWHSGCRSSCRPEGVSLSLGNLCKNQLISHKHR